jgi:hypothetical protein
MDLHGQQKIMALHPRQRTQVSLRWPFVPLVVSKKKMHPPPYLLGTKMEN